MPAPCSHGAARASAESTERDQLAGERNVRDADDLIVATDHSGAQQHIHTADYWLYVYTRLRMCLHIRTDFRAVIVILRVNKLSFVLRLYAFAKTRVGVGWVHLVSCSLTLSYLILQLSLFLRNILVTITAQFLTLGLVTLLERDRKKSLNFKLFNRAKVQRVYILF